MKNIFLSIIFIAILALQTACQKNAAGPNPLTPVEWLQEYAVEINSVDPDNEDFSDLEPLRQVIGDAKIVMLGEAIHGDGTTFLAKSRLIKFLHREMGFDVLAFESDLYACWKVEQFIRKGQSVIDAMQRGVFWIWSKCEQVRPLMEYIQETRNSASPIEIAGFDMQFNYTISGECFLQDLKALLQSVDIDTTGYAHWDVFAEITQRIAEYTYYYSADPPNADNQTAFFTTLETLQKDFANTDAGLDLLKKDLWGRILENLRVRALKLWNTDWQNWWNTPKNIWNLRDIRMGENLVWLSDVYYPDRKIVVWAATGHLVRHIQGVGLINPTFDPDYYKEIVTMGDIVWNQLDTQAYTIAFTYHGGWTASDNYAASYHVPLPSDGSFEDLMYQAGLDYAFVDLRNPPEGGSWLSRPLISRALFNEARVEWTGLLDGFFYIKRMFRSTLIGSMQEKYNSWMKPPSAPPF